MQDERRSGRYGQIHLRCSTCGRGRVVIFPSPDRIDCPRRPEFSICDCSAAMTQITQAEATAHHNFGLQGRDA